MIYFINLIKNNKKEAFVFVVVCTLSVAMILVITNIQKERSKENIARCSAMGLQSVETSESIGKTTVTSRFCIDLERRVYWPKGE